MSDCLFCKIAAGEIPSKKAYEDELVYAFYDIAPQAPVHVLVIPKKHIKDVSAVAPEDGAVVAAMFAAVKTIAAELGLEEKGYRVVSNCGPDAGQTVNHLHFHILGGKELSVQMA